MKLKHDQQDSEPRRSSAVDQTVRLIRRGQYLFIHPRLEGLGYAFQGREATLDAGTSAIRVAPLPLFWEDNVRGVGECWTGFAGLEPLVARWLRRHGHRPVRSGRRPPVWPRPDLSALEALGPVDLGFLELVRTGDRGLVRYDPARVEVGWLLAQLALAWPELARVVAVASSREDVHRVRAALAGFGVEATALDADHHPRRAGRVVIATPAALGRGCVGIEKRTLFVSLDPPQLTQGEYGMEGVRRAARARLIGLLPAGRQLPPRQQALTTALFGPHAVVIPRHGYRPRDVRAAFIKVAGGPALADAKDELALKRRGVWHHPVRNRRVAKLAGLLAHGSEQELRTAFPELPAGVTAGRGRVIRVLVESVEHADALSRFMPGVPILSGEEVWAGGLDRETTHFLSVGRRNVARARNAAVITAGEFHRLRMADVLVRADGGRGGLDLPEALAVEGCEEIRRPLLVIDCADRHHPALRQHSRARREAYRAQGWELLDEGEPDALAQLLQEVGGKPS